MGASSGKSKSVSISDKTYEEQKEAAIYSDAQSNGTATLGRKNKKKKLAKVLSPDVRIDKFTSTDGSVVASLTSVKKLVDGSEKNVAVVPTESIKDIQELRDACVRRGILCPETNRIILGISDEEAKTIGIVDVPTNETLKALLINNEQVNTVANESPVVTTVENDQQTKVVETVENDQQTKVVETVENDQQTKVVENVANDSVVPINHLQDTIEASVNGTSETVVSEAHDEQVVTTDSVNVSTSEVPAVVVKKNKKKSQEKS